ncbi:unnamed protein product [Lactuca saligna]|uniref:Bet v I/Major latex protein domain-containing protein n=1 Tax=Lactuca saligna TaxID=75948 RepID=A0AA35ZQN4_LACSI|nr:unnamed protein product [Lactuca saligna]
MHVNHCTTIKRLMASVYCSYLFFKTQVVSLEYLRDGSNSKSYWTGRDKFSGQRGDVGSTICWNFTNDGKPQASKQIIEAVDEKNHKIVFKVIGGELVEIYKTFKIIFHVEEKGGKRFAIYTYEFEKPDTDVPYPTSLMDFMTTILKEMDENASRK